MQEKYLSLAMFLASKLDVHFDKVQNIIYLLNDKSTVPYIAKYCKSQTAGMSLKNIRLIARAVFELRTLEERRSNIVKCIQSQNKMSSELLELINKADNLQDLDDIYLPYMPKRQTKALQALQRGLAPLATEMLITYANSPDETAEKFVNSEKGVLNNRMALDGARQILLEKFSENVQFLNIVRKYFWENAFLVITNTQIRKNSNKYKEFANYSKQVSQIPAQKLFEIFEGRADNYLKISINVSNILEYGVDALASFFNLDKKQLSNSAWLSKVIDDTWTLKLLPKLEAETLHKLREIAVSSVGKELTSYLRGLFYLPPAGKIVTMSLLPNAKSGVVVAVVDDFGKLLESCVIYPLGLNGDWYQALASLAKFAVKFNVSLISIATLPGYRDIERLCRQLAAMYSDLNLSVSIVDAYAILEYAQSESSKQKDYDSGVFAAISLARRSQNPLAEFAKINSKEIALLQHDFSRDKYQVVFDEVLEDSVCAIGLDLNDASLDVLCKLPCITVDLANQILAYREKNGKFNTRAELKNIPGIDEFIFQQVAGFVYVYGGDNILDTLNIHPDSYYVAEKISRDFSVDVASLIANNQLLDKIVPEKYIDDRHDTESVKDIVNWLKYKVKDPRGKFLLPKFMRNVTSVNDLVKDMELEGIVTKITSFGAFVDVGVYQDGLIPLALIKEKNSINLKIGKVVKVKIADVDKNKKRFSLDFKSSDKLDIPKKINKINKRPEVVKHKPLQSAHIFNTAMADALAKLKKGE